MTIRIPGLGWAACLALAAGAESPAGKEHEVQLFEDLAFRRGFHLSYPSSSRGREVADTLRGEESSSPPAWRLCQWGTRHSLAGAKSQEIEGGGVVFENEAKRVVIGAPRSEQGDLLLEVRGGVEYGDRDRRAGEAWPHLLVEQDATAAIPLADLDALRLRIELRLESIVDRMKERLDPRLHTAQLQLFLIVKGSSGDYFWFGVPFFDFRHELPPPYRARDGGKDDATGKLIYTIDSRKALKTPLRAGRWASVDVDLLPEILEGLRYAAREGYLESGDPAEYRVVNMNLGWELPGTLDASVRIRGLDVRAVRKPADPEPR